VFACTCGARALICDGHAGRQLNVLLCVVLFVVQVAARRTATGAVVAAGEAMSRVAMSHEATTGVVAMATSARGVVPMAAMEGERHAALQALVLVADS
jgi:hypothetical protein